VQIIETLTATGNTECQGCCRSFAPGVQIEIDHMVPRARAGANSLENYQLLCQSCNSSKSTTPYYDWVAATVDISPDEMQAIWAFHAARSARIDS
jgi:5-methylcytosine-specific restriction endonuclease McrA